RAPARAGLEVEAGRKQHWSSRLGVGVGNNPTLSAKIGHNGQTKINEVESCMMLLVPMKSNQGRASGHTLAKEGQKEIQEKENHRRSQAQRASTGIGMETMKQHVCVTKDITIPERARRAKHT
ncbi:unnamed protein product, partial [Pleuronectes platessa]